MSDTILLDFDFEMLEHQTKLERLDVSFNNLENVHNVSALQKFPNLTHFIAAGSQLPDPAQIIQNLMPSIKYLDISGNFVGKVNKTTFEQLIHLDTLKLNNTNLAFVDSNPFEHLESLRILDISHNDLRTVNFSKLSTTLSALTDFNAADCRISNASKVIQHLGPAMADLDLSGNTLGILNSNMFKPLINLKTLHFGNTNMLHYDSSVLQQQTQLRFLNISYNQLTTIDLGSLSKSLVKLDLEGNDLVEVRNLKRENFPMLESLAISKNRIPCEYLMSLSQDWEGLKFIGNPMEQTHDGCSQGIDQSNIQSDVNTTKIDKVLKNSLDIIKAISPSLMYAIIIVAPILIVISFGCICFIVQRQLFRDSKSSYEYHVPYIENEQDKATDAKSLEHIYEEIESNMVLYDHLRFDTDPMPLSATKSHYHNSLMLKKSTRNDVEAE